MLSRDWSSCCGLRHVPAWKGSVDNNTAPTTNNERSEILVFKLKKNYSWNYGDFNVDAQTVGEAFEKIEADTGSVTKEKLLDASRAEDSPTHGLFEWDDAIAGEKYRLEQARQAIAQLRVQVISEPAEESAISVKVTSEAPKTFRAYVSPDYYRGKSDTANFISTETALADPSHRQSIIRNALAEFERTRDKYSFLEELASLYEAIDHETERYGA